MRKSVPLCLMVILIASEATADAEAVERYRDFLPEEIMALPESERHKSVPMMYLGAANTGTSPAAEIFIQANLATLMYPAISDLEGAKRAFQRDLGEEPTG